MIDTGKTAFFCDCGDGKGRFNKQLLCFADPDVQDILLWRNMKAVLEPFSQINLADADVFCKRGIGKGRILYMLHDMFCNEGQPIPAFLVCGDKLFKQIIKSAVNFHLAFASQKQLLQSLKMLDTALRICKGEDGYFCAIQAAAGKIDNGKQSLNVAGKAIRAALG